ncbi:MAG: pitrilysin family protein [Anaerolineales bacterium]|nr:pitrilysin family protein [Anaerolineales bacterium]
MPENKLVLPDLDIKSLPGPETILRREFANGVTVLARENFASPSVVIQGYLPVGSLQEEPEQSGLAYLTSLAVMRGTTQRTFEQLFESLESIGARLNIRAGGHTTSFQGKSLAEDLPILLDILLDVLSNPIFPKREIERLKSQHLTALAIRAQDTGAQAELAFDEIVYADHPYRYPVDGYIETVQELSPAAMRRFHADTFGSEGIKIAIVGGVKASKAAEAVEASLGAWSKRAKKAQPELPPVKSLKANTQREARLEGKQQSDIVVGCVGPNRFDEGYLAAAVGNNILGRFGLMGRIGEAVRESAGLAYSAYSVLSGGPGPGPWQVLAGVNPKNEQRAVEIILKELGRFVSRKVSTEELLENQMHYIGRLPLQLESNEGVGSSLIHLERYGLGLDYYQRYPELIAGITRAQILETARRFIDPERMAIAIAGPEEREL